MSKQSGIGANLYVAEYDLSGDVGAITSISGPRTILPMTSIVDAAERRILARRDGSIGFNAYWHPESAELGTHPALSTLPTTDRIMTAAIGTLVGSPAASLVAKQTDYAPSFGADASLIVTTGGQANGSGLEWGQLLTTGEQTYATGTVDGASIDLGATSTLFGAAGYLHVFSLATGTATFAIQDSANDTDFADVTGLVFTAATGPTSERKTTALDATIRRYVRLEGRGVHGNAAVAVNFIRHLTNQAI